VNKYYNTEWASRAIFLLVHGHTHRQTYSRTHNRFILATSAANVVNDTKPDNVKPFFDTDADGFKCFTLRLMKDLKHTRYVFEAFEIISSDIYFCLWPN